MLTDTGPLVALLDKKDAYHGACLEVIGKLRRSPLITTWPCFTEAMYLLGAAGGHRYQDTLWQWRQDHRLSLIHLTESEVAQMSILMTKYQNVPMDLADASLVAVGESRNMRRLFSLDSDFYIYRLEDGSVLEVVR